MSNYNTIKNAAILAPTGNVDIGTNTNPVANIFMSGNLNLGNTEITATNILTPKISSIGYPNNATAASLTGGETITINGSGFQAGLGVYINNTLVAVSTVVSSTQITFTSPARSAGNYTLVVINPDGGTGSFQPGITYSALPTWATVAGSIANVYETASVSVNLSANSDSNVTYAVTSNSLPSGVSLNSSTGAISGTAPAQAAGATTYNFQITAEDVELQDAPRAFSITVNADSVSWVSPSANANITANINSSYSLALNATSAAGKNITYSALSLPTGLTLSGSNITGNFSSLGTTGTLITATASDTNKSASLTYNYTVISPFVTATGGTVTTSGNYKIHTFTGSGTLEITNAPGGTTFEVLIVGGGGSGGYAYGGAGGAGGVLYGSLNAVSGNASVTVGAGGVFSYNVSGATGSNSSVTFNGTTFTARGGGAGGSQWYSAQSGGSGGGGQGLGGPETSGSATQTSQSPLTGYGNNGGSGYNGNPGATSYGGGGGGAGGAGVAGGTGGVGIANPITGSTTGQLSSGTYYIAGGGGGGPNRNGGLGGGGKGSLDLTPAGNGGTNTGGGGGGGHNQTGGSNGGSGVVIFRYQYQ
jgi:hypothetical protein